jgi:AcrR family transcriptional regulator
MDRDDWQAVTIEAIADRAEYAKGTVYRHFPSKDDLYARLVADWNAATCDALDALDADGPFEAVLREVLAVAWARATGDRVYARLLQHVGRADFRAGLAPETRAALAGVEARMLGLFEGLIDWGVAEGAIPPAAAGPRLFAILALLDGALRQAPRWAGAVARPEAVLADAALAVLRAGAGGEERQMSRDVVDSSPGEATA